MNAIMDLIPGHASELLDIIQHAAPKRKMDMLLQNNAITIFVDQGKIGEVMDIIRHLPPDQKREFYLQGSGQLDSPIMHGKAAEVWEDLTTLKGTMHFSQSWPRAYVPGTLSMKDRDPPIIASIGSDHLFELFVRYGSGLEKNVYNYIMSCPEEIWADGFGQPQTIMAFADHGYAHEMWNVIEPMPSYKQIEILKFPGMVATFIEQGYAENIVNLISRLPRDTDKMNVISADGIYNQLAAAAPQSFAALDNRLQAIRPNYQNPLFPYAGQLPTDNQPSNGLSNGPTN